MLFHSPSSSQLLTHLTPYPFYPSLKTNKTKHTHINPNKNIKSETIVYKQKTNKSKNYQNKMRQNVYKKDNEFVLCLPNTAKHLVCGLP